MKIIEVTIPTSIQYRLVNSNSKILITISMKNFYCFSLWILAIIMIWQFRLQLTLKFEIYAFELKWLSWSIHNCFVAFLTVMEHFLVWHHICAQYSSMYNAHTCTMHIHVQCTIMYNAHTCTFFALTDQWTLTFLEFKISILYNTAYAKEH